MEELDPVELSRALSEVPLFREVQRVVAAQRGPVNWEIASQIAKAVAGGGSEAAADASAGFEEACRLAELRLTQELGLDPPHVLVAVSVVPPAEWAAAALEDLKPWVERFAQGLRSGSEMPEMMTAAVMPIVDAVGGLLLGAQMGFLTGTLARSIFGHYDLCMPQAPPDRLIFVEPNVTKLHSELDVDLQQFRLWLALHEVAHNLHFDNVAWARPHFRHLVEQYIDGVRLDPAELMGKLNDLGDPDQLERLMQRPDELLPISESPEQEAIVARIRILVSLFEGQVDHMMKIAGRDLIPEFDKITEAMVRRRAESSSAERLLRKLLGLEAGASDYRRGKRFIEKVVEAGQLAELWSDADKLPDAAELDEPSSWLNRMFR